MDYNIIIVFLSICIVISYFFSEIAKRTNIPSVLMLIVLGVIVGQTLKAYPEYNVDYFPYLKILGTIGLIMIVLEGALDLELTREKSGLIVKASLLAVLGILAVYYLLLLFFIFY